MNERRDQVEESSRFDVLYDFSALAPVVANPAAYTGVQRVVHELAVGLARSPEVRLMLYGGGDLLATEAFAKGDYRLGEIPFVHGSRQRQTAKLANQLAASATAAGSGTSVLARGTRWLAHRLHNRLQNTTATLRAGQLAAFRIYHSPVYALPPAVLRARHLCKFITIYDLTPVKMPEHSVASILDEYRAMLRSVRSDQYFLCISESTKRDWCEHTGSDPVRCFVTPLAAADYFRPCEDQAHIAAVGARYGVPMGGSYFLGLSTLEPRKNIGTVLAAFGDFLHQTKREDLYLVLVGRRGWNSDPILSAVDTDAKLRTKVIFTGYVPEDDLAALYTGALAFLYLSFYEGFGLPPLEAMQCGVPVVTSDTSSLPEVVGTAGVLLSPTDRDGLCDALLRLVSDAGWRASLCVKSLAQAERFTWARCVEATITAYKQAVPNA